MLQKILYMLPEISLLFGIIHLYLRHFTKEESPKMYARIARIWLLASIFCSIIFYDKSLNPAYLENNGYTLLFKGFIGIFSYIVLGLAPQYFSAIKKTGCKFYSLFLLAIIIMNMMLSSINIQILAVCYAILMCIHYFLQEMSEDKLSTKVKIRYIFVNLIMLIILIAAVIGLHNVIGDVANYQDIKKSLDKQSSSFIIYMCISGLIIPFLYALGIAPFHSLTEDKFSKALLPYSHYLAVVAPWVYWGVFIKLNIIVFAPYASNLIPAYMFFALASVIFGVLGANTRINLHRIYAFSEMYYFGIVLLLISLLSPSAYFVAVLCLLACILGINGGYLVFYSLKSHNEYLSTTLSLSGLAETRAFATVTLLISLFSLLNLPPLVGFLSASGIAVELISRSYFMSLGIIFACLLMLTKAYLEIIKTSYFEHKIINYDVENKSLKFYMLLNIGCIAILAFNPFNFMEKIKDLFYVIFI